MWTSNLEWQQRARAACAREQKAHRSASSSGVPNSMVGMREVWSAYFSLRRLTRSISRPATFMRAVSRCLDWSGLLMITATCAPSTPAIRPLWWEVLLLNSPSRRMLGQPRTLCACMSRDMR